MHLPSPTIPTRLVVPPITRLLDQVLFLPANLFLILHHSPPKQVLKPHTSLPVRKRRTSLLELKLQSSLSALKPLIRLPKRPSLVVVVEGTSHPEVPECSTTSMATVDSDMVAGSGCGG